MSTRAELLPLTALLLTAAAAAPWQAKEFPIGYWYGPPPEFNRLGTWQTVKDAGFTFAGMRGYGTEGNLKLLDSCQQVGLTAMVVDNRINPMMTGVPGWQDRLADVVKDYGSHPALYGYFLTDEPNFKEFEALGQISGELQRLDPQHLPYINLFPTYANTQQLGCPSYADHLDKYLELVKPGVLSYDHYALVKAGGIRPDYYENLALVREYGLKYDTPPWYILLSLPHLAYRDPTEGEMRWQVYTSLAYGMKGLLYFTYWTPPSLAQEGLYALVDDDGKPSRLYPLVQAINREVTALGPRLLSLKSTGVYHTGPTPRGATALGTDAILSVDDDTPLVIGLFEDPKQQTHVLFANPDYEHETDATLHFKPNVKAVYAVSKQDGSETPVALDQHAIQLKLAAGDGALLRLETSFDYPQPPQPKTTIDFQFDTPGDLEGWGGLNSLADPTVSDGALTLTFTGEDPSLMRRFLQLKPDQYRVLKVRMKLSGCHDQGQVFWATMAEPAFSDKQYLNFPIQPDGEWHEYTIPVGEHAKWQGQSVVAIRLDPTTGGVTKGSPVSIDWIRGE